MGGLTEHILTEAIKDLQIEQMTLTQEINAYSSVTPTTLDKKQKDKRTMLLKQMAALNELIRNLLKYQKIQNDLIITTEQLSATN
jgi:hypothetical protein